MPLITIQSCSDVSSWRQLSAMLNSMYCLFLQHMFAYRDYKQIFNQTSSCIKKHQFSNPMALLGHQHRLISLLRLLTSHSVSQSTETFLTSYIAYKIHLYERMCSNGTDKEISYMNLNKRIWHFITVTQKRISAYLNKSAVGKYNGFNSFCKDKYFVFFYLVFVFNHS